MRWRKPSRSCRQAMSCRKTRTEVKPSDCAQASSRSIVAGSQESACQHSSWLMAVLGMKSLGGSGEMVTHGAITAEEGLRYAMSLPVATTISGMDSMEVLEQNLAIAGNFKPMSEAERRALEDRVRVWSADGRYELFKTTVKYDGDVGRQQHQFPSTEKMPA